MLLCMLPDGGRVQEDGRIKCCTEGLDIYLTHRRASHLFDRQACLPALKFRADEQFPDVSYLSSSRP